MLMASQFCCNYCSNGVAHIEFNDVTDSSKSEICEKSVFKVGKIVQINSEAPIKDDKNERIPMS